MSIKTDHMMTVADLIERLQNCNPEAFVVMSKDAEGNGYSPLSGAYEEIYVPDSTWSGETYPGRELTDELKEDGYEEEDVYDGPDALDAVVLSPVN